MIGLLANPKLIGIMIAAALIFGAGYKLRDFQAKNDEIAALKKSSEELKIALDARDALQVKYAETSKTLEIQIAKQNEFNRKLRIEREKEYAKDSAYSSCVVPSYGVILLNNLIAAGNATSNTRER